MKRFAILLGLAAAALLVAGLPCTALAQDAAPKISAFASAQDLAEELNIVAADLKKAVVDKDTFNDQVEGRFTRDGNLVALIAIAVGLSDETSAAKPNAKAIVASARSLAQAKGYDATKQAVEALQSAIEGQGAATGELKWEKVATLKDLMKEEVPSVNNRIKTGLRRIKTKSEALAANAATMALIAANAELYVADTEKPDEGKQWTKFAQEMQAAAKQLAAMAHARNEKGAKAAENRLDESCHACHAVFNPEKDTVGTPEAKTE